MKKYERNAVFVIKHVNKFWIRERKFFTIVIITLKSVFQLK